MPDNEKFTIRSAEAMFAHFSAFQKLACSLASPCKTPKETLDEWKQSTDYVNGVSSKDPYKAEQVNSAPKLTMHHAPHPHPAPSARARAHAITSLQGRRRNRLESERTAG